MLRPCRAWLAVAAGTLVLSLPADGAVAAPAQWKVVRTLPGNGAASIAAITKNDVWATGKSLYHWNGKRWREVRPGLKIRGFTLVVAGSRKNVWAFAQRSITPGDQLAASFDGKQWWWRSGADAAFGKAADALPNGDLWRTGNDLHGLEDPAPLRRRRAGKWKTFKIPFFAEDIDGRAPGDVWSVGQWKSPYMVPAIGHWNGRKWKAGAITGLGHGLLNGVTAVSAKQAWAVGKRWGRDGSYDSDARPVLLHWNGRSWTNIDTSVVPNGELVRVASDGRGGVWTSWNSPEPRGSDELYHYRNGRWSRADRPVPGPIAEVGSLVTVPGTTTLWAGVSYNANGEVRSALLRYPR